MQQGGGRVGYTPECADAHRLWHCGCFVLFIRTPKRLHKILRITVTGMPPQRLRCSSLTRSSTLNLPSCRVPDANRISCLWLARRYTAAYRVSRRGARRLPRVRALALGHFCATRTLLAPSTRTFVSHLSPAPSPRTFPWHLPLVFPSHRPLAPSTRTLPSVGVQLSSLHSSIPRSWSAPATKSACTSLRSTCRWCPRVSRGYP